MVGFFMFGLVGLLLGLDQPGSERFLYAGLSILSMLWSVFLFVGFCCRYIIFHRTETIKLTKTKQEDVPRIDLWATGDFLLESKFKDRFSNAPAFITQDSDHNPVVVSPIDFKSKFFGITYERKNGLWEIPLGDIQNKEIEVGHNYFGFTKYYSLRINYVSNNKNRSVILNTKTKNNLDILVNSLLNYKIDISNTYNTTNNEDQVQNLFNQHFGKRK